MALAGRLRYARDKAGLTLQDVMERTGIGTSSLSEYENGKREPRMGQLRALANAYDRSAAFLLDDGPLLEERIAWREQPSSPARQELEMKFLRLCEQYRNLEAWCDDKPPLCLPRIERGRGPLQYRDVQRLAHDIRSRLVLGDHPGRVLIRVLEEVCGVKVFHLTFDPSGAAACTFSSSYGPAILLNGNNVPWRRNFDLAHELFHLLAWDIFAGGGADTATKDGGPPEEKLATCFAANLLMPEEVIRPMINRIVDDGNVSPDGLIAAARQFDVSVDAVLWRLHFIQGWSDEKTKSEIDKWRSISKIYDDRERDDPPERPMRFLSLAIEALRHGNISLGRFAEYLGTSRGRAQAIRQREVFSDEQAQPTDIRRRCGDRTT